MTKQQAAERDEAITQLRAMVNPGDTVYTILRSVSRSGMSRHISTIINDKQDGPYDVSYLVARAAGYRRADDGGLVVQGGGMDMGFDVVYQLGRVLFPDVTTNGHKDGGYALNHRWL